MRLEGWPGKGLGRRGPCHCSACGVWRQEGPDPPGLGLGALALCDGAAGCSGVAAGSSGQGVNSVDEMSLRICSHTPTAVHLN